MAKALNDLKDEGLNFGKVLLGTGIIAVGGAVAGPIGAFVGGYTAEKYVVKGKENKKMIKYITWLTTADMILDNFIEGGVVN